MKQGIYGLPLRSAVIARRRRRLHILAGISALCLSAFVAFVALEAWPQRAAVMADVATVFSSSAPAVTTPAPNPEPTRPVYRHSIVPGGAYSRAEVADAVRKDAVVAAHYRDVDVDKVHTTKVAAARAVYVSYRVGDQVYWTKKPMQLSPGETMLTDGNTEIRARCGNLVSDHAQQPVAAQEPALAALDEQEPETGSSTIAGAIGPDGGLTHVPFFDHTDASSMSAVGFDPASGAPSGFDVPMLNGGGAGGRSPHIGSSTGLNGTSLVAPLGGSERTNSPNGGGSNGGGSNGGGPNGGGPNGGGSNNGNPNGGNPNGGDPNGGGPGGNGPNGGGDETPSFVPPTTTTGEVTTTTGDAVTTTTGNPIGETTGDTDGDIPTVPEPGTLVLLGLGACGLAARAVRARRL